MPVIGWADRAFDGVTSLNKTREVDQVVHVKGKAPNV